MPDSSDPRTRYPVSHFRDATTALLTFPSKTRKAITDEWQRGETIAEAIERTRRRQAR